MDIIMNNFVDLHNHSLPFVDDGASSLEEAIADIRYLREKGISDIVLTSHYILNTKYSSTVIQRQEILEKLREGLQDCDVKLYLGNEVYINKSDVLINLLKDGEITTINNSRYILVEFPLHQRLRNIENVLCELNEAGFVPIIAHPERYAYIQKNFDKIYDLLEFDCRLQCNLTSLVGSYGSHAKKVIKKLLKEGLVSFLATDFHRIRADNSLDKAFKKLKKSFTTEEINKLLVFNPKAVLNNEDVEMPSIKYRSIK